jgi:hypothetical protein
MSQIVTMSTGTPRFLQLEFIFPTVLQILLSVDSRIPWHAHSHFLRSEIYIYIFSPFSSDSLLPLAE